MALNIERIRNQVQKAIQVAPFEVTMKRIVFEDDGRGGVIRKDEPVDAFVGMCLFDNSGDVSFSRYRYDGGQSEEQSGPYLIIVYENDDQIKEGDYFEHRGSRYEVTKVTNVLALNIYWQVKLREVKL